jgi:site-specific recombinase XerD
MYLIYGNLEDLRITDPAGSRSYSTLSGYVSTVTGFYCWLEQNYGSQMTFCEGERRCRVQSYLYGQIYSYKYKYIIDRSLPDVKGSREYIKWYTEEEKELLCNNFLTLRDEAVFRLTLAGFRIDEALSICLSSYDPVQKIVQPTRSKKRQSAVSGFENKLRKVRISDKTCEILDRYIYEERTAAENESRIISDVMFLNLNKGNHLGKPLSYANYRKNLRNCARRAGLNEKMIRTHSGRSTRVMEILECNAQNPNAAKTDVQIQQLFGWASMDSITSYMNHNSEIMAFAAYEKHRKDGERND